MHVKAKIKDLNEWQYDWVMRNVPVTREFKASQVRVCAEFELTVGVEFHVELEASELAAILTRLNRTERLAEAALVETPE
jgi:hypothetical protein